MLDLLLYNIYFILYITYHVFYILKHMSSIYLWILVYDIVFQPWELQHQTARLVADEFFDQVAAHHHIVVIIFVIIVVNMWMIVVVIMDDYGWLMTLDGSWQDGLRLYFLEGLGEG